MAQLQQGEKEVQCEADKLFGVWAHIINPAQKMCAEKVQKSVLNEGEWDKVGALLIGNRVISKFPSYYSYSIFLILTQLSKNYIKKMVSGNLL